MCTVNKLIIDTKLKFLTPNSHFGYKRRSNKIVNQAKIISLKYRGNELYMRQYNGADGSNINMIDEEKLKQAFDALFGITFINKAQNSNPMFYKN